MGKDKKLFISILLNSFRSMHQYIWLYNQKYLNQYLVVNSIEIYKYLFKVKFELFKKTILSYEMRELLIILMMKRLWLKL